jgi:plastocyanin
VTAQARSANALRDEAVVKFGKTNVGSPFPPPDHDASFHAYDDVSPMRTVIAAGGRVTFLVAPSHKIAIYEPGVGPEDVDLSALVDAGLPFPFPPLIDDPDGRIVGGADTQLNADFATGQVVEFGWTFEEPGLYLVLCEVLPHFAVSRMYAWVDVR